MSVAIKVPEKLVKDARRSGAVYSRSVPKQIEYWSRIGKIAEENPDLSFAFIKELLMAQEEAKGGDLTPYVFG